MSYCKNIKARRFKSLSTFSHVSYFISLIIFMTAFIGLFSIDSYAADSEYEDKYEKEFTDENGDKLRITCEMYNLKGAIIYSPGLRYDNTINFEIENNTTKDFNFTFNSSNPKLVKLGDLTVTDNYGFDINDVDKQCVPAGETRRIYIDAKYNGDGKSVITLGDSKYKIEVGCILLPSKCMFIDDLTQTDFHKLRARICDVDKAYDGALLYRRKTNSEKYETIKNINDLSTDYVFIDVSKWNKTFEYAIDGYIEYNGEKYTNDSYYLRWSDPIKCSDLGSMAPTVKVSGKSTLKISWKKATNAKKYELYVAEGDENSIAKKIYTAEGNDELSYTHKVKQGTTYYYFVKIYFRNGNVSKTYKKMSGYIPRKNLKYNKISQDYNTKNETYLESSFLYTRNGKVYTAVITGGDNSQLVIYRYNNKSALVKCKTIKLDKYDYLGNFYAAPDGNYYIVYGYENFKESRTKTVMKVVKYDSKWKKRKTAKIRANASNSFDGIVQPFRSGNCSMTMMGSTLYIHTSRLMFKHSDGLNHQSNISFQINTKTMKANNKSDSYVSHSFNQFAKFKDTDLYLVDHGDAYPRSVDVTFVNNYRKDKEEHKNFSDVFKFVGEIGQNYTGATINGMEVGKKHVLISGTSRPQFKKIKGVKGNDSFLKNNLYLITLDRNTGKKKFRWITNNHPKKSNKNISYSAMVKISDDRFAILYVTQDSQKKSDESGYNTLTYYVVNDKGEKVYKKDYKNTELTGIVQPILYKGYIVWSEKKTTYSEDIIDGRYVYNSKVQTITYKIPATY